MAAITTANVALVRSYINCDMSGAQREVIKDILITLTAQGGTVGDIPASALGLGKIYTVVAYQGNNTGTITTFGAGCDAPTAGYPNSGYLAGGTEIWFEAPGSGTGARANYTGIVYARVTGTPSTTT
jgi:hypothetical protein